MQVTGQDDLHRNIDVRHDGAAVGVHKIETEFVLAFILMAESHAQSDGALGMHGRELLGSNGIECAEEIEFEVLISRRIAQDCHLNVHEKTLEVDLELRESLTVTPFTLRLDWWKVSA